jgi:hypothetical protein
MRQNAFTYFIESRGALTFTATLGREGACTYKRHESDGPNKKGDKVLITHKGKFSFGNIPKRYFATTFGCTFEEYIFS